jgi:hypothetical protein
MVDHNAHGLFIGQGRAKLLTAVASGPCRRSKCRR